MPTPASSGIRGEQRIQMLRSTLQAKLIVAPIVVSLVGPAEVQTHHTPTLQIRAIPARAASLRYGHLEQHSPKSCLPRIPCVSSAKKIVGNRVYARSSHEQRRLPCTSEARCRDVRAGFDHEGDIEIRVGADTAELSFPASYSCPES